MSNPQVNENQLPGNELALTAAEKASLEGFDENGKPVEPPPAADPATDAPPATTTEPAAAPPAATAAPQPINGSEPAAAPPPAAPPQSPIFAPTISPGTARDFGGELKILKEKFAAGEIDDDQYEEQRELVIEARTIFNMQSNVAEQLSEQGWKANVNAFLQMPDNALLVRSPEMTAMWQSMMNMAVSDAAAQNRQLSDWEILCAGRDRLMQAMQITPPAPPVPAAGATAAAPPAPPPRVPPMGTLPPNLSAAPAAAPSGAKTTAEQLASMDNIQDIEKYMASIPESQADELCRSLPGAFTN